MPCLKHQPRDYSKGSTSTVAVVVAVVVAVCGGMAQLPLAHCDGQLAAAERAALVDIYAATNGHNWNCNTGWINAGNVSADPCTEAWCGVRCAGTTPNHVTYDVRPRRWPVDIVWRARLQVHECEVLHAVFPFSDRSLELFFNNMTGSLPSSIGQLVHLA